MTPFLAAVLVLALTVAAFAASIQKNITMQAKPNSIWFQNEAQFAQWQKLKQASSIAALSAYEKKVPGNRAAWQFINPLHATLVYCEPAQQRVHVEMKTKGYMQGTDRFLYSTAIIH